MAKRKAIKKKGFGVTKKLKTQEILKQKAMLKQKMLNESVDHRNLRYNIMKALIESNRLMPWQKLNADKLIIECEKILDWLEEPVALVEEKFEKFAKEFDQKLKEQDIVTAEEAEEITEEDLKKAKFDKPEAPNISGQEGKL